MPDLATAASEHWALVSVLVLLAFVAIETIWPDGRLRPDTTGRWLTHFAVYIADLVLSSTVAPWVLLGLLADQGGLQGVRLFAPVEAAGGPWVVLAVGLVAIDFVVYWMHRIQHAVPFLWRFHAVHHADTEMDVSTALLHHPLAYLAMAIVAGLVLYAAGMPAWVFPVYGLFEVTVGAFQHVATPIPDKFERAVRWLLVTPGMHQVHHSADARHYDQNFANVLSVWDRLFGTLHWADAAERKGIRFGVEPYTGPEHRGLVWVFTMPARMGRQTIAGETDTPNSIEPIGNGAAFGAAKTTTRS